MKKVHSIQISLLFYLFLSSSIGQAQNPTQLWGMTSEGGQSGKGVIFKTDGSGSNESVEYSFAYHPDGENPVSIIEASDGKFYGVASSGGANNLGVLFQFDPVSSTFIKKIDFDGVTNGQYPYGSLMQASDGKLYGMTQGGGLYNKGVLYQYNPATSTYAKKLDFDGATNGSYPTGALTEATDGMLYGLTVRGGIDDIGVLFQFDPSSSKFLKKFDFLGVLNLKNESGYCPGGTLVQALNGMLYGTTSLGGTNNDGVLFQFDPATSTFTKKLNFSSFTTGKWPGNLILASDGNLFGTAGLGGLFNNGVLFRYDPSTSEYSNKMSFMASTSGSSPGCLIQTSDGKIYGLSYQGGTVDNLGVLFQFDPVTSSFTKKIDFNLTNGGSPSCLISASDGNLYGMTSNLNGKPVGTIFQFVPSISTLTTKFVFSKAPDGISPYGSLIQASDGMLYGMTDDGGANGLGVIFQFNPTTSTFVNMFDFDNVNGSFPYGSLTEGSEGILYGMTHYGGIHTYTSGGVIFQFDLASSTFTKKFDFGETLDSPCRPEGSLIYASDGKLYGMAGGGTKHKGVIFQYDPLSSSFSIKLDFDGSNGADPTGSLMQASDGKLYGVTPSGGAVDWGVIFQFDPASSTFTKMYDFGDEYGPSGSLIEAADGKLYGTAGGGANNKGVLFQFDPVTSNYLRKYDFDYLTTGSDVRGSLLEASNGNIYGLSHYSYNGEGAVFQYSPLTSNCALKFKFTGANGSYPMYSNLIEISVSVNTEAVNTSNCAGSAVSIPYTLTGAYDSDNVFTAQLSDANGSFVSAVNIGYDTSRIAGSIIAVIPVNTLQGSGYRIRVVSSSPAVTGKDNGSNIIINAAPNVTAIATDSTLCLGSSTILTGGGAISYVWSDGITDGVSFVPSSTTTYTVTGSGTNTCTNTATRTIRVDKTPVDAGVISGIASVCTGQTALIYSVSEITNASSYLWTLPEGATGESTSNSIQVNYEISAVSGSITVKGISFCGFGQPSGLPIVVNAKPQTPVIILNGNILQSDVLIGNQWYNSIGLINDSISQEFTAISNDTYYSIATVNGCVSDTSNSIIVIGIGITPSGFSKSFTVYPNPVLNELIIENAGVLTKTGFEIINSNGKTVYKGTLMSKTVVQTSNFSPGVYLIKLNNGNTFEFKKIIKQ